MTSLTMARGAVHLLTDHAKLQLARTTASIGQSGYKTITA